LNNIISTIINTPGEYTLKGLYTGTSDTDSPVLFIINTGTVDIQLEYIKLVTPNSIIKPIQSRRTVTTTSLPITTTSLNVTTTSDLYNRLFNYTTPVLNWNFILGGTGVPTNFTGTNASRIQIDTNTYFVTLKFGTTNGYIQQQINEYVTTGKYYVQIKISSDFIISCLVKLSTSTDIMINQTINNPGEYLFSYDVLSVPILVKPTIYVGNIGGNNLNVEYIRVITPNSTTISTSSSSSTTLPSSSTTISTSSSSSTTLPSSSTTISTSSSSSTTTTPIILLTSSALLTTTTTLSLAQKLFYYTTSVLNWNFSAGGTTMPPNFTGSFSGILVKTLSPGVYAVEISNGATTFNFIQQTLNEFITRGQYYVQIKLSSVSSSISCRVQLSNTTGSFINKTYSSPGSYIESYNSTTFSSSSNLTIKIINTKTTSSFNVEYIRVITPNSQYNPPV
jgi:hypothetical protein